MALGSEIMYNKAMKSKQSSNYIIGAVICQVVLGVAALTCGALSVSALTLQEGSETTKCEGCLGTDSEIKSEDITRNCTTIRESLKNVQKRDARARVYLGGYYEMILTKYMTPLNVKLVEKNISNVELIENQNNFAKAKTKFSEDFVNYQKELEDLVLTDCKNDPSAFYNELVTVRTERAKMEKDMTKLSDLIQRHIELVKALKGKL